MNLSIFDPYIEKRLIRKQISPCGKLVLFDYTNLCQYERAWDEVTLNTRGTVYELSTGRIVARTFPKFFNWSELSTSDQIKIQLSNSSYKVLEKLDGSLGICYFYDGRWRINTRGSFTSDQAIKGTEILYRDYVHQLNLLNPNYTFLFEIIYPENRIVVDYKNREELILLSVYDTKLGVEVDVNYGENLFTTCKEYKFKSLEEIQENIKTLTYNEEGYVVKFKDGTRVKFKGDEYVKMHRVATNISPLVLWGNMEDGKVNKEFLANIPEEFRDVYENMTQILESRYSDLLNRISIHANRLLSNIKHSEENLSNEDRKTISSIMKNNPNPLDKYIFPFLTRKVDKLILKEIKPKGNNL